MNMNIGADILVKALKVAREVLGGKNGIVKNESQTISLDTSVKDNKAQLRVINTECDVLVKLDASISTEGKFLLDNLDESYKATNHFNKDVGVEIATVDKYLKMSCESKTLTLSPVEEPVILSPRQLEDYEEYTYNTKDLYRRIKKLNKLRASDDTRPILKGILFDSDNLVALDGYVLGLTNDTKLEVSKSFVIDNATIRVLLKILNRKKEEDLIIQVSDKHIKFLFEDIEFTGTLLEGDYMNYRDIIRTEFQSTVTLNTKKLLKDSKYLVDLAGGLHSLIKLDLDNKKFEVNNEKFTGEVEIKEPVNGEFKDCIAFNGKYLQKLINEVETEEVKLGLLSSVNPMVISEVGTNDLQILAPVRLN